MRFKSGEAMSEISQNQFRVDIEDFAISFADEVARAIEFRIEHDCLDNVENRLRQHGYVKERTCHIIHNDTIDEDECDVCGSALGYRYEANYCCSCGAKVVE